MNLRYPEENPPPTNARHPDVRDDSRVPPFASGSLDVDGDGFREFLPEALVLGVGELQRERVRPRGELDRPLLLGLPVVQMRGVERDRLALLDVPLRIVHDHVVVAGALLEPVRRGGELVTLDAESR